MRNIENDLSAARPRLLAYARRLTGEADEAEEITQETLLRAARGADGLRKPDRLLPWLYRIATHLFIDRRRRRNSGCGGSGPVQILPAMDMDALRDVRAPHLQQLLEGKQMSDCIHDQLLRLSEDHRMSIILHDLLGYTHTESAAMLGISPTAAKVRLHRARKKFRSVLENACTFSVDQRGVLVCDPKGG